MKCSTSKVSAMIQNSRYILLMLSIWRKARITGLESNKILRMKTLTPGKGQVPYGMKQFFSTSLTIQNQSFWRLIKLVWSTQQISSGLKLVSGNRVSKNIPSKVLTFGVIKIRAIFACWLIMQEVKEYLSVGNTQELEVSMSKNLTKNQRTAQRLEFVCITIGPMFKGTMTYWWNGQILSTMISLSTETLKRR